MTLTAQLKAAAGEIAERTQQRLSELERQLAEIESRKSQIEAQRETARLAPKRLESFPGKLGEDYLCPRCWIESGLTAPLRPQPSQTSDDMLRCRQCHFEMPVSF